MLRTSFVSLLLAPVQPKDTWAEPSHNLEQAWGASDTPLLCIPPPSLTASGTLLPLTLPHFFFFSGTGA
jgi:hypothetical protein